MIKVLEGRNKATYYINTNNLSVLIESLKFYAPIGLEGKLLKILLVIVHINLHYGNYIIFKEKLGKYEKMKYFFEHRGGIIKHG